MFSIRFPPQILTLTISAFNPEAEGSTSAAVKVAGDYSAVFPLLVVSVFISLMTSRDIVVYKSQRSRGDITAVPEVLCRPGMEGAPLVVRYHHGNDEFSYNNSFADSDGQDSDIELAASASSRADHATRGVEVPITKSDFEKEPIAATYRKSFDNIMPMAQNDPRLLNATNDDIFAAAVSADNEIGLSSSRLDELLGISTDETEEENPTPPRHRRTQSAPLGAPMTPLRSRSNSKDMSATANPVAVHVVGNRERAQSGSSQTGFLVRVSSFGDIQVHQPSLMEQARMRSASPVAESRHRRVPSLPTAPPAAPNARHTRITSLSSPRSDSTLRAHRRIPSSGRHSRKGSDASQLMSNMAAQIDSEAGGALSLDDIEQSFSAVVNERVMGFDPFSSNTSPWTNN